jgi:hypothetical protein
VVLAGLGFLPKSEALASGKTLIGFQSNFSTFREAHSMSAKQSREVHFSNLVSEIPRSIKAAKRINRTRMAYIDFLLWLKTEI